MATTERPLPTLVWCPTKGIPKTAKYQPTSKAKILQSETCSLRLRACHETQPKELPKHAIGIPQDFELHSFWLISFKEHARIYKQSAGQNPIAVSESGHQYHMDFWFLRASIGDVWVSNLKTDRIVESFDGYKFYLIVVSKTS